jgi:hypothetical protein
LQPTYTNEVASASPPPVEAPDDVAPVVDDVVPVVDAVDAPPAPVVAAAEPPPPLPVVDAPPQAATETPRSRRDGSAAVLRFMGNLG